MKRLLDKLQFLADYGFTATADGNIEKMDFYTLHENLYGYLEDYRPSGFCFIRYPDQKITIKTNGKTFYAFGVCDFGALVLNETGQVYLLNSDRMNLNGIFIYANHSLEHFLQSYCQWMVSIYTLKGLKPDNSLELEATDLLCCLKTTDAPAMEAGCFWPHMAYLLEEGGITLGIPPSQYMADGRLP